MFRAKQGDPQGEKAWRPLRKSVADLKRRAEVSGQVNQRYAEALGSLDTSTQLGESVARGEYVSDGFTNRHIAGRLYPNHNADKAERARVASRISYRLRLLRTHGLIRKVKNQRRYHATLKGRRIISAVLAA